MCSKCKGTGFIEGRPIESDLLGGEIFSYETYRECDCKQKSQPKQEPKQITYDDFKKRNSNQRWRGPNEKD